jgi:hypothetical protein
MEANMRNDTLIKRMAIGLLGGLLGTLAMALFGAGLLLSMGLPASLNFSFIGDAAAGFFSMLGIEMAGGVPLGMVVYGLTGLALGLLFVVAVSSVEVFRINSMKKGVGLSILYVEIVSQLLLTVAALILKMTATEMAQWAGMALIMHFVYGSVLGAVVSYGLRATRVAKHV